MANFRYSARDSQGRLQSGEIDAPSESAVADQLQRRQLIPLNISEIAPARQLQLVRRKPRTWTPRRKPVVISHEHQYRTRSMANNWSHH